MSSTDIEPSLSRAWAVPLRVYLGPAPRMRAPPHGSSRAAAVPALLGLFG